MNETATLAEHAATVCFVDLPSLLVEELKVLTLDFLGVGLRGAQTEAGRLVARFQREYGAAKPEATLLAGGRAHAQATAFANAVAAHSIELDDVDDLALFHFGPPVLSAALAVAEACGASGEEFLAGVAVGCETMARLSRATNPSLRDAGFHTTAVCGVFGATAAAARLEGLSPEETASAFGIAGAHAAGLMEMYGPSMQKRLNPGPAAQNGVVAARLARLGYTGSETILEGERGVLCSFARQGDASALVDGLGTEFPVRVEYKAYACARPIHNAVDCALLVRPEVEGRLADIREMTVWRHPTWAHYHRIPHPRSVHEAQVSLSHAVAVALVEGAAFLDEFSPHWIAHPEVARLSELLRFEVDPSLRRGVSCRLRVTLADGRALEAEVDFPKGSSQNPMNREEHLRKFERLAGARLGPENTARVQAAVDALESLPSVRQLTAIFA